MTLQEVLTSLNIKQKPRKTRKLKPFMAAAIKYSQLLKIKPNAQWFRFFRDIAQPSIMPKVVTFISDYPVKRDKQRLIFWAHKYLLDRQQSRVAVK